MYNILQMFYQAAATWVLFYVVISWGSRKDNNRLNRIIMKAGSVVGMELDSVEVVVEKRIPGSRILAIINNEKQL